MSDREHGLHLETFRRYRVDPCGFGEDVLGVESWSKYRQFLHFVRDFDRVAVRAGQKVSKTLGLAVLSLWWASTRPAGKVIFCLPSDLQGQTGVYAEILRLHEEARVPLGGDPHLDTRDGIVWSPQRRIFGFSAADSAHKTEKFLGHSGDQLFIVDEAPGVPDQIIKALDGNRAGGGKIVMTGNPTRNHGKFYDAFHSEARSWKGLRIASTDSPNVTGEKTIPGLALPSYIAEKREDWGEQSWDYQVKILGEFCEQDERAFISLVLVSTAQERWTPAPSIADSAEELRVGVDPARMGKDKSVVALRRGNWVEPLHTFERLDNVQLAAKVLELVEQRARPGEYVRVKIDQTNNNGVSDILKRSTPQKQLRLGLVEVMSQDGSSDPNFVDRRAQIYGSLKEWLKTGTLPRSSDLQAQLTSIKTDTDARLRIRLESKRDIVARLGHSPDHADALALSCFEAAPDTALVGDGVHTRPMIFNLSTR